MSFSTNGQVQVQDSAPATVTYSEVQNTGSQCIYADRDREIGVPRQLIISHQKVGTGDAARMRSMVKFTNNVENSALEGDVAEHRIHLVLDSPVRIVDKDDITDVLAQMIDFISGATFVDQIVNQEV
jgi:hypothetical protein